MLGVVPTVMPIVQDKAWVPLVQQVVWDKIVVQGMVAIVVGDFEGFIKIIAYFTFPLVATQNQGGSSNSDYMYQSKNYSHYLKIDLPHELAHVLLLLQPQLDIHQCNGPLCHIVHTLLRSLLVCLWRPWQVPKPPLALKCSEFSIEIIFYPQLIRCAYMLCGYDSGRFGHILSFRTSPITSQIS